MKKRLSSYNDIDMISSFKHIVAYILLVLACMLVHRHDYTIALFMVGLFFIWWTDWMIDVLKRGRR